MDPVFSFIPQTLSTSNIMSETILFDQEPSLAESQSNHRFSQGSCRWWYTGILDDQSTGTSTKGPSQLYFFNREEILELKGICGKILKKAETNDTERVGARENINILNVSLVAGPLVAGQKKGLIFGL